MLRIYIREFGMPGVPQSPGIPKVLGDGEMCNTSYRRIRVLSFILSMCEILSNLQSYKDQLFQEPDSVGIHYD